MEQESFPTATEKKCPHCGSEDMVYESQQEGGNVSFKTGELIKDEKYEKWSVYRCKNAKCQKAFLFKE